MKANLQSTNQDIHDGVKGDSVSLCRNRGLLTLVDMRTSMPVDIGAPKPKATRVHRSYESALKEFDGESQVATRWILLYARVRCEGIPRN